jgi:hypothetical protein
MRIERIKLHGGPLDGEWRTIVLGQQHYDIRVPGDLEEQLTASIKMLERGMAAVPVKDLHYTRFGGSQDFYYEDGK